MMAEASEPDPMEDSRPRRKGIYLLPNLITTGALFAGFLAVVAAMDGNFVTAAVAIYIAMVLDGMDGRVARMTSTESEFGKQYDSLADMVSFGLAPSLVFYLWGAKQLEELGWLWGKLGWLVAFFFAVAAALRLARYNSRLRLDRQAFFRGVAEPVGGRAGGRAGLAGHGARGFRGASPCSPAWS
jgi:CDP-diacylglycerol---serine O-phosphatidyltransferase